MLLRAVQRRMVSHIDMGITGANTDNFIVFETGVKRNSRSWCCGYHMRRITLEVEPGYRSARPRIQCTQIQ
jgi:hypothetical protein